MLSLNSYRSLNQSVTYLIGIEDTPGDTENGETEDDIVSTVALNNR